MRPAVQVKSATLDDAYVRLIHHDREEAVQRLRTPRRRGTPARPGIRRTGQGGGQARPTGADGPAHHRGDAVPAVARLAGTVLLYPLLFFAGMWTPKQNLAPLAQQIGNYTPLGAAVQAMERPCRKLPGPAVLVMAAYAVVFGVAAIKMFRWE